MLFDKDRVKVEVVSLEPKLFMFKLLMNDEKNWLDTSMNSLLLEALDVVELEAQKMSDSRVFLVLTGADPKYFSLGLSLQSYYEDEEKSAQQVFDQSFNPLILRLLLFPMISIAAINGHCIAGGLVLSLACDYRVMCDGKSGGLMGMNEIHLPSSIPTAMAHLVMHRICNPRIARDVMLLGQKFTSKEAFEMGIIDHLVSPSSLEKKKGLWTKVLELGSLYAHPFKKGPFIAVIKKVHHEMVVEKLSKPDPIDHFGLAAEIRKRLGSKI